jgi:acetyl esterase
MDINAAQHSAANPLSHRGIGELGCVMADAVDKLLEPRLKRRRCFIRRLSHFCSAITTTAVCAVVGVPVQAAEPIAEARIYKKIEGRELRLYIVKPADWKPSDTRPAIVFFHGGGWVGGEPSQFNEQSRYLAGRGMVCFQAEYRLLNKANLEPPLVCVRDAKSAVRWVRSHAKDLGVDRDRIAAGGGSAGGHLAAFVGMVDGLDDPDDDPKVSAKADALILFNPVFDNGSDDGYGLDRIGQEFRKFSPAHNVSKDDPPTIVFLGTNDQLIPVDVIERFKTRMTRAGVRCVAIYADGQEHGFFNKEPWRTKTLQEADRFLRSLRWLEKLPAKTAKANPLPKGSTYVGTWTFRDPGFLGKEAQYSITVTERGRNRFRGKGIFSFGGREIKTDLEGTIRGSQIEYHEAGEGAFRFFVSGAFRGDTISFEFEGTGTAGENRFGIGEIISR